MTGPPGNRMRYMRAKIPDLYSMVHEYVLSINSLGGTATDASIANAATEAFEAMVASRRVDEGKIF